MATSSLDHYMAVRNQTIFRVGVAAVVVVLVGWFFFWQTSRTWQYEEVVPGLIYRASMRTEEEFTGAAMEAQPNSLALIAGKDEIDSRLFERARAFGHRNRLRVLALRIEPGADPTDQQLAELLDFMQRRPKPILVVDMDGARAGKLIAAYRLRALKLPLNQVLDLAALPDAPPGNTEQIRDFARRFSAQTSSAPAPAAP